LAGNKQLALPAAVVNSLNEKKNSSKDFSSDITIITTAACILLSVSV
jgi:hypothetical protein